MNTINIQYCCKNKYKFLIIMILFSVLLCSCGKQELITENVDENRLLGIPESIPDKDPILRIAVSSDLHIAPDIRGKAGVSPLYEHNTDFAEAMLWDAQQQGTDMLLLSGDITNSSRPEQHETLLKMLCRAKENGLPIYVIDGNHDIGRISTDGFAEYYREFGYDKAYSRDENSLSYSLLLPDLYLLMVDTGGFRENNLSGDISEETLSWIEQRLEEAKKLEIPLLVVGHYPVLTQQSGDFIGGGQFKELLLKYEVPLYVCGHMHGRNVAIQETLTELVVEQIIAYPCSYAIISIYDSGEMLYEPRMADIEAWAKATDNKDELFTEFNQYRETLLREQSRQLVEIMRENRVIGDKQAELAEDFYYQFHRNNALGTLFQEADNLKQHPGYSIFLHIANGNAYGRWIPQSLDYANTYMKGFVIPSSNGQPD